MEQLGVISVEHRDSEEKGHQSNIYTLYDYAEIWNVGSSEDVAAVADEVSEMKLVAELRAKGYTVIKEKEPDVEPTKAQQQALEFNQFDIVNATINPEKSQELERYSLEQIKEHFDYNIMVHDNPYKQKSIDMIMNILYDNLNTSKKTIRVSGEDKPAMVVQSKLMKLDNSCIMYAIEKFSENTERVKNPISYMLTILYKAQEQYDLDIANQVQYDMYN